MAETTQLSRRTLIALGATYPVIRSAQAASIKVIDTHQHLWDRSILQLNWITKGSVLDRNYLTDDYLKATDGIPIYQAVYMEVDATPSQHKTEADYITTLCQNQNSPTKAAIISGRPDSPTFNQYLDQFRENPYIKGLRQVLHGQGTPAGHSTRPAFVSGIRELGKRRLSFDLCLRESDLNDGVELARKCPETQFILDHCGNPNVRLKPSYSWQRSIEDLAKQQNVTAKISGIIAGADPKKNYEEQLAPFVNHVWDSFGPDRVVFGGDWPVCLLGGQYADWYGTLKKIAESRPQAEREKLFYSNALRIYRLT
ncbi:MAG: hypothetical protein RJA81_1525 [Planctomycetota bacterium]|jgi:predicted TIM-barrel fold metal-dependent hydrolase